MELGGKMTHVGTPLRFPLEVRGEKDCFEDVRDTKLGNSLWQARVTAAPRRRNEITLRKLGASPE